MRLMLMQPVGQVLHHDDGRIHQQAHGDGEAAQGHGVQAQARGLKGDRRAEGGEGQHGDDDEGAPEVAQQDHQHQGDEKTSQEERQADAIQGMGDEVPLVIHQGQHHAFGQALAQLVQGLPRVPGHGQGLRRRLSHHPQAHVLVALVAGEAPPEGGTLADLGDIAQENRPAGRLQAELLHGLGLGGEAAHGDEPALVLDLHDPGGAVLMAALQGFEDLVQAHALEAHALGLDDDLELALLAAQAFDPGHAGYRLEARDQYLFRVIPQLHGIGGGPFEHDLHDFLEATRGARHKGHPGPFGEVPDDAREAFGHELPGPPGIGVTFEGHHHLDDFRLHGAHHALDAGQAADGLFHRLGHGQFQFGGGPARALDEQVETGQGEIRKEVPLQRREAGQAGGGPYQGQGEDPALARQHPVEPAADEGPVPGSESISGHGPHLRSCA